MREIAIKKLLIISFLAILLLLLNFPASAQTSQITWSVFSTGYGESSSINNTVKSIVGEPLIGTSSNELSGIYTGFFSNTAAMGILTEVKKDDVSEIPSSFGLSQNYPNPFNPSTNIKFSLPEQSSIKIVIYDLLGRKVKTLINDIRPEGVFTIRWSGENEFNVNVSSGIYFYSLYAVGADNKKYTGFKKMILLK